MGKTYKDQRTHDYYVKCQEVCADQRARREAGLDPDFSEEKYGWPNRAEDYNIGSRYGNHRHMWAKLKVTMRRIEKKKEKVEVRKEVEDELKDQQSDL